jgi:hypothetical protein
MVNTKSRMTVGVGCLLLLVSSAFALPSMDRGASSLSEQATVVVSSEAAAPVSDWQTMTNSLQIPYDGASYYDVTVATGSLSATSSGSSGFVSAENALIGEKLLTTVPEPYTLTLFGLGLLGMGAIRRLRKQH